MGYPAEAVRLYAISDLHVATAASRQAVVAMPAHPGDWLILAGDIGETPGHLEWVLSTLGPRFERIVWVPGNHDLWTLPTDPEQARGVERYLRLVELCQRFGVLTPEDPYSVWEAGGTRVVLAPLFLLYDYTFRPDGWTKEQALQHARRAGVFCTDELLLHPDPYPSREAWCWARVATTTERLAAIPDGSATVLISHFPLRHDLVFLPRIPEFSPWCGTGLTEEWHRRFRAVAVVYGHLHVPRTSWRDAVRFEEVSFGYPQERRRRAWTAGPVLRQVLPYP